jgi:hypothetical protein
MGVEARGPAPRRFGVLLRARDGRELGEFAPPPDNDGIAFNGEGRLYVATAVDQTLAIYSPPPVAQLGDGASCASGPALEAQALLPECALTGNSEASEG